MERRGATCEPIGHDEIDHIGRVKRLGANIFTLTRPKFVGDDHLTAFRILENNVESLHTSIMDIDIQDEIIRIVKPRNLIECHTFCALQSHLIV
jgi:hypothetical protein